MNKLCPQCGNPVVRRGKFGPIPIYCTPKCQYTHRNSLLLHSRSKVCTVCSEPFTDTTHQNKFKMCERCRPHRNQFYRAGLTGRECEMLLEQKTCKICGTDQNLCHDHCHSTGKPRGRLCHKCNTGLGLFGESAALLKKAIDYLDNPDPRFNDQKHCARELKDD